MRDTFHDLETFSRVNLKTAGSHKYARNCEVMIWAFADGDDTIYVWDLVNRVLHWQDDLSGAWTSSDVNDAPTELTRLLLDPTALVWFHNGGQFDFPVLDAQLPTLAPPLARRRDTMVQAFAHALPGALEKLGDILNMKEDQKKLKDGKRLVRLFCMPQNEAFEKKYGTDRASRDTHPEDWQKFIEYAGGDIVTMRAARKMLPKWNYSEGKQVELCLLDWKINARGFQVDTVLAEAAVRGADKAKKILSDETAEITDGEVQSATQRDALLAYILAEHGVELPDMRADTLERRIDDPSLPDAVRDLLKNRLQASMNSVSKFKTLLKSVCEDGRLRGCMQFRGASRTGRWAHRMFQPGNLPRPTLPHSLVEIAIWALKNDDVELIDFCMGSVMQAISNTIRGAIVAPPGKKLVVSDLSNIEGRVCAWVCGEDWKVQAFTDFDTIVGYDEKDKPIRKGWDLYILAYASSFNVPPESVPPKGGERQIGKVQELMFQYGGGVGAWITGAATYGIDLVAMTEAVFDTIPPWAIDESVSFLDWLYEQVDKKFEKRFNKLEVEHADEKITDAEYLRSNEALCAELEAAKAAKRFGLPPKVFITCDAIKRLWRKAHPQISTMWKELEDAVRFAIENPGNTVDVRGKLKVRRKGGWLRIGLPSGRCLCYPEPKIEPDTIPSPKDPNKMIRNPLAGSISYTGLNQYTRTWGRVTTYGGKLLENVVQAIACDQLAEPMPTVEEEGYEIVLHVHDELVTEAPDEDEYSADKLAVLMCMDLGWNEGLPLAAAGFETDRYKKD